ncbi:50S ribosomal protein L11 methyltransferase [Amorphus coralli]|uniref:50S ribosomal protein L11 methyltransferase n=1 Tax=Amorphus coralli TaxID=340680 RepID=UPI000406CC1B|nr:50S ribosomal protein L11 methyltransferase [Amorphus coralli]
MSEGESEGRVLKVWGVVAAENATPAAAALEAALDDESAVVTQYEVEDEGPWAVEALVFGMEDVATALADIRARIADPDLADALTAEWLGEEDWVAKSLEGLKPVRAGRFIVHGSHDGPKLAPSRWRLEIDAGQAFGTGHHETTVGCLRAIEDLGRANRLPQTALDLGTGTGVLAAALVRLGVRSVIATDIDPIAVDVARDNLRGFGVGAQVRTITATGFDHPTLRTFRPGMIVANILARPLLALAQDMRRQIAPGGWLVLSGLRLADERRIRATYRARGFRLVRHYRMGAWVTLVFSAPHDGAPS